MILGKELGRLSLGQMSTSQSISLGFGVFSLVGQPINLTRNISTPMKIVQDQWDVDEWGRFYRGGAMRYTL